MATTGFNPSQAISFGPMQVDWETRIDFEKMRRERMQRARDAMASHDLDYLLLFRVENARYVTGIKRLYWPTIRLGGGPVVVLPREGLPGIWITDPDFASRTLSWYPRDRFRQPHELEVEEEVADFVDDLLEMFGKSVEKARIGVDIWSPAMHTVFPGKLPNAKFLDGYKPMIQAQMIKTPEEQLCMKMAYVISEAGMQAAIDILRPGVRECELVGACFNRFWQFGAETTQCSQAVSSGPGTWPYRRFHTDRIVQMGELVNLDFGACFNGYFGDFGRAFICGKKPSPGQASLLRRAYDMQMGGLAVIRPGMTAAQLCKEAGRKHLGHGIGIAAFQPPHLEMDDKLVLQPGMIFAVDCIAADPEIGGIHTEDQIIVTENGCEVYTTYPYTGVTD
ncbi:MAG: aminopeptidase P family protein [Burkholderiales bacterium]|nr:aminopeptidase P family protein [Burkholderiales bacterium]